MFLVKDWKLYLTHREVVYMPSKCHHEIIPLSEISHITVLPETTTIQINKKHGTIYRHGYNLLLTNFIRVYDVENCHEFVAAVRREMDQN